MKKYNHPWYEGVGWRNGIWEKYMVESPIKSCTCVEKQDHFGGITVTKWSENQIPSIANYRCCIKCKNAYTATDAAMINRWLGFKVEPIKLPTLDLSFLDDIEL